MIAIVAFVAIPVGLLVILFIWTLIEEGLECNKYKYHRSPSTFTWGYSTKTTKDINFNHFLTLKNADPDNWITKDFRVYYLYIQKDGQPEYTQIIFSRFDFLRYCFYLKKQIKIAKREKDKEEKIKSLENAQEITNKIQQIVDNRVIKSREDLETYINELYKKYKYWY